MRGARVVRRLSGVLLVWAVLAVGGVSPAPPGAQTSRVAEAAPADAVQAPVRVRLGVLGTVTDAGFFIGMDLGYYREQGLEIETVLFDSGARMVAPLAAGQLDAGGGAHSAGLFNAAARGIGLKMVADRGQSTPGHGFQALLFRRESVEAGR